MTKLLDKKMTTRPWLKTFPSLQERNFRVLWAGMLPGILATQMNFFANGYLAFELTGKATSIGLISLGFGIPMFLFSLPAGVIADRYSKQMILMTSQGITATAALIMAVLVISGALEIWHMAAISFLQGTAFSFRNINAPHRRRFIALSGRLGSGCWPALPGEIGYSLGSFARFQLRFLASPSPRLSLAHPNYEHRSATFHPVQLA